jgi:N6-adenosine-specific RNA methylase IME4
MPTPLSITTTPRVTTAVLSNSAGPDPCSIPATDPLLPKAFELIEAWGFEYKTVGFYWVKQNEASEGFFTGLGYWTRANPEQCLLATRGKPARRAKDVRRLVVDRPPRTQPKARSGAG